MSQTVPIMTVIPSVGLSLEVYRNMQQWKLQDVLAHKNGLPPMKKNPNAVRFPVSSEDPKLIQIFINTIKSRWTNHSIDRVIIAIFKRYIMATISSRSIVAGEFVELYRMMRLAIESLKMEKKLEECIKSPRADVLSRISATILCHCTWEDIVQSYEDLLILFIQEALQVPSFYKRLSLTNNVETAITQFLMQKNSTSMIMLDLMALLSQVTVVDITVTNCFLSALSEHSTLERFIVDRCRPEAIARIEYILSN